MTSAFWPNPTREFSFGQREYLSPQEFVAMRTVAGTINFNAPPYTRCKALISRPGKSDKHPPRVTWHTVERQFSFGQAMYFANEIVIRLSAASAGDAH